MKYFSIKELNDIENKLKKNSDLINDFFSEISNNGFLSFEKREEILVKYDKVKAVTPGQACVLYYNDICIGGGIIKEVRKNDKKLWYLL